MQTTTHHISQRRRFILAGFMFALLLLTGASSRGMAQINCPGYTLSVVNKETGTPPYISFIINMTNSGGGYSRPPYSFGYGSSSTLPYNEHYGSDTFLNVDVGGTFYTADGTWHCMDCTSLPAIGHWYIRITRNGFGCITIEVKYEYI